MKVWQRRRLICSSFHEVLLIVFVSTNLSLAWITKPGIFLFHDDSTIKMDIKLTSHMAVAMGMRYVRNGVWDAAERVASRLFHGERLISMPDTGIVWRSI